MIVQVLQPDKRLNAGVGEQVEIDSTLGSTLACFGIVRVVAHDPAPQGGSVMEQEQETSDDDEERFV